jgi:putative ABC transport system permease protein
MTFVSLLLRNLRYHWRGNLTVFLGVALGGAVLTGALFVGDSLRGSLRELTLDQLGWVQQAMTPGRFFRAKLADDLGADKACAALLLQGSAATTDERTKKTKTAGKVTILGVDDRFWPAELKHDAAFWQSSEAAVVLNHTLAEALGVQSGAKISFNVQKNDAIPRETLLGKRDDVVQSLNVTVKAILPDEGMGRFTLRPSPEPVRNAFIPIKYLQQELQLGGKANAVLVGSTSVDLSKKLPVALTLEDWNLKLRTPADRARDFVHFLDPRNKEGVLRKKLWDGRVPDELAKQADEKGNLSVEQIINFNKMARPWTNVESGQLYLDAMTEQAVAAAAKGKTTIEVLVYLADAIADAKAEMAYAVIAAVDCKPAAGKENEPGLLRALAALRDDEIALVSWPGMPLQAKKGDTVEIGYYVPDERNQLQKTTAKFRVAEFVPLEKYADDPDWTPEFPGITDKLKIADWEKPPFPFHSKRVKPVDEDYWKRYRATPKAYITLKTGQRLWSSRFGKLTMVRIAEPTSDFQEKLLSNLRPETGGFVFQDVRRQALQSSSGSNDFGVLFLLFSFFLIAAALLLVGLLFRLNLDRRANEIGLLLATGWSQQQVRWLLLGEGSVLAVFGAGAGLLGALVYGSQMLHLLAANWPGGARLAFLRLHAGLASVLIGYSASVAVSLLTIVWATLVLGKMALTALLAGETTASVHGTERSARRHWNGIVIAVAVIGAATCLIAGIVLTGNEAKAGSFFGAGAMLLIAALALAWRWLRSSSGPSNPQPSLARLGMRNAGRHPVRSVLTVGLLASATFLIVAVEAFHKETGSEFLDQHGGSGGFALLAETDVPIFQDLNEPKTQVNWNVSKEEAQVLRGAKFNGLRVRPGDDASCLNLYQPLKPRILGVPAKLLQEGRFHFAASQATSAEEKKNPWLFLEKRATNDDAVPAIIDATTAEWTLKVKLGETLNVADDQGDVVKLRIVALLEESIFQGEVLIAEREFLRLFPRQEGFRYFLVETDPAQAGAVRDALQTALADQGASILTTAQRLQSYMDVENMYLDTFKALGGLGLLLGAAGLAIVLLRGVWERRGELALLRALGFRGGQLAWLVLAENALLLALGLAAGTIAALLAVAPHLAGAGATPLWGRLAALLAGVALVGLLSGAAAVWGSLRTPLLTALRRE